MSKEYEEFLNSERKKVTKRELPSNAFEKVSYSKLNSKQKENLLEELKSKCRKIVKEKTGKRPFTNINLVRI